MVTKSIVPFAERLCGAIKSKRTPVMVGIDPCWDLLPQEIRDTAIQQHGESLNAVASAYKEFTTMVVKLVAPLVAVVKFQIAFFEAAGPAGMCVLQELTKIAREIGLLVILDAKRSDVGSTASAYAQAYLGATRVGNTYCSGWSVDGMTINPYLGAEGIEPFLEHARLFHKGIFVLVRTSNPGAGRLQDLVVKGRTIYQTIGEWVENWSASAGERYGPVGAVIGATVPQQVAELRERMPHAIFLLPGYGTQGGTAHDTAAAFAEDGLGAVVNNSRGLLYAFRAPPYAGRTWQDALVSATKAMITDLAENTPAGNL